MAVMGRKGLDIGVGCCGFACAQSEYLKRFKLIEIQQTFYDPPGTKTALRWREKAGAEFRFTVKAWQLITHTSSSPTYRRLRRSIAESVLEQCGNFRWNRASREAWRLTREFAEALGASWVVFQSPASFAPTEKNKANIKRFLSKIERGALLLAWEPRGRWTEEEIAEICEELVLTDCVDPFRRLPTTSPPDYFRLHGKGGYRYRYTDEELRWLAELVRERGRCYVLFNNTNMLEDAERLISVL